MTTLRTLELTGRYFIFVTMLFSAISGLWSLERALAVFVGGLIMTANFWILKYLLGRALQQKKPRLACLLWLPFKLVVVASLLAVALFVFKLDNLGLVLSVATFLPAVGLALLHVNAIKIQTLPTAAEKSQ